MGNNMLKQVPSLKLANTWLLIKDKNATFEIGIHKDIQYIKHNCSM